MTSRDDRTPPHSWQGGSVVFLGDTSGSDLLHGGGGTRGQSLRKQRAQLLENTKHLRLSRTTTTNMERGNSPSPKAGSQRRTDSICRQRACISSDVDCVSSCLDADCSGNSWLRPGWILDLHLSLVSGWKEYAMRVLSNASQQEARNFDNAVDDKKEKTRAAAKAVTALTGVQRQLKERHGVIQNIVRASPSPELQFRDVLHASRTSLKALVATSRPYRAEQEAGRRMEAAGDLLLRLHAANVSRSIREHRERLKAAEGILRVFVTYVQSSLSKLDAAVSAARRQGAECASTLGERVSTALGPHHEPVEAAAVKDAALTTLQTAVGTAVERSISAVERAIKGAVVKVERALRESHAPIETELEGSADSVKEEFSQVAAQFMEASALLTRAKRLRELGGVKSVEAPKSEEVHFAALNQGDRWAERVRNVAVTHMDHAIGTVTLRHLNVLQQLCELPRRI